MSTKPARPEPDQIRDPDAFPAVEPSSRNQPPPSSASMRGIIDALLQGSLVELYQAYGVACAPLPREPRKELARFPDVSAVIGFSCANSAKRNGCLSLSMSPQIMDAMQADSMLHARHADWSRELVNQLMGRLKNRLLPYGMTLQAGLPSSIGRDALEARLAAADARRVYRARTLHGEVVAALDGALDESELVYVGPATAASEGELIFF